MPFMYKQVLQNNFLKRQEKIQEHITDKRNKTIHIRCSTSLGITKEIKIKYHTKLTNIREINNAQYRIRYGESDTLSHYYSLYPIIIYQCTSFQENNHTSKCAHPLTQFLENLNLNKSANMYVQHMPGIQKLLKIFDE